MVKGKREAQELAVFKTNEYYNKNYFTLAKTPKTALATTLYDTAQKRKYSIMNGLDTKRKVLTQTS